MFARFIIWLAHLACRNRVQPEEGQVWVWYDGETSSLRRVVISRVLSCGAVVVRHEAAEVAYRPDDFRGWVCRQGAAVDWEATEEGQEDEET